MLKKECLVTKQYHQYKIDEFAYAHHISKKLLKSIKLQGDILVNGNQENNQILPEDIPLKIVYEDLYLMVIDKVPCIPCIPTRGHPHHTLANAISYYYQQIGLTSTVHMVNRLDKETAGLMIVAKYRYIHDLMSKRHIYRLYRAHVNGKVEQGVIDLPIYKIDKQMKRVIDERGKISKTHYQCIQYKEGISLVECQLETGRTHQIRVHMSAIGHPLVGDSLYGNGQGCFDLTSFKICFIHPVTHQLISLTKQ